MRRGVTAHPSGRWESRIGVPGSKHIYLGLFEQEQASGGSDQLKLLELFKCASRCDFYVLCETLS